MTWFDFGIFCGFCHCEHSEAIFWNDAKNYELNIQIKTAFIDTFINQKVCFATLAMTDIYS